MAAKLAGCSVPDSRSVTGSIVVYWPRTSAGSSTRELAQALAALELVPSAGCPS